ncbi:MAG TPA: hypothetical protein VFG51_00940 [Candidatus Saccharimonadia bacterium]|nr:hypothetical protein [Candidatus Saccharimonadia bacterium]
MKYMNLMVMENPPRWGIFYGMTGLEQQPHDLRTEIRNLAWQYRHEIEREEWEKLPLDIWDKIRILGVAPCKLREYVDEMRETIRGGIRN